MTTMNPGSPTNKMGMSAVDRSEPDADDEAIICPVCGCENDVNEESCDECGADLTGLKMFTNDGDADNQKEAKLSYKARKALSDSDFLYIDPKTGRRMFPVQDKAHIRNALSRLPQSNLPAAVKARLLVKLKRIAKAAGIDTAESKAILAGNLIVENITAPVLLSEKESDGYHRAKFLVTTVDSKNENGRIYPRKIADREAAMATRTDLLGQDGHPFGTPKFTEQFLMWEKFMLEGDKEYAVAKVVPTEPDGKNFILLAQAGAEASCSRRGSGSVKEGEVNGVKGLIVSPDDYKLLAIDILPPHAQSDPNAFMVHFESKEDNSMEITLEELRGEHADLVEAIESPLKQLVEESKTKLATAEAQLTEATKKAGELETALTEAKSLAQDKDKLLVERDVKLAALDEQVKVLTEQVKVLPHLLEKVKSEKGAWLIFEELKGALSPADVDVKFAEAKKHADSLIEGLTKPAGKAIYGLDNPDPNMPDRELTPEEKEKKDEKENYERSRRMAGISGVRVSS